MRKGGTIEMPPSSYYKVSLSTEKAKKRQSSLGLGRSTHNTISQQQSVHQLLYYNTPVSGLKQVSV